jgi:hypothetical protein
MMTSRRVPVALAAAAAALAIGLSATASAADLSVRERTAEPVQTARTAMPAPRVHPLVFRKRIAARYRARLLSARPVAPLPPVTRIAANWPLLILGIGY